MKLELVAFSNYSKTIKRDNCKKEKITNYQVTHIFGRTKNPFLFTAPWNIVWKPKILDPFTGHESKGENTNQYQKAFVNKFKQLYSEYIHEYNELVSKYFTEEKIKKELKESPNDGDLLPELRLREAHPLQRNAADCRIGRLIERHAFWNLCDEILRDEVDFCVVGVTCPGYRNPVAHL